MPRINHESFRKLLNDLPNAHVTVIGDAILDHYIHGTVSGRAREAPVLVLKVADDKYGEGTDDYRLGGAANALTNLAKLGVDTYFVSAVGDDRAGRKLRSMLMHLSMNHGGIGLSNGLKTHDTICTPVKTRYFADGQPLFRMDREKRVAIMECSPLEEGMLNAARQYRNQARVALISDYGLGIVTPRLVKNVCQLYQTVVVDPKPPDFGLYAGADILTPNHHDLAIATGMPTNSYSEVNRAARKVLDWYDISHVIVTRGDKGIAVVSRYHENIHIAAHDVGMVDITGAGDTVAAVITGAFSAGALMEDAAQLANFIASIAVTEQGTAAPGRKTVMERLALLTD